MSKRGKQGCRSWPRRRTGKSESTKWRLKRKSIKEDKDILKEKDNRGSRSWSKKGSREGSNKNRRGKKSPKSREFSRDIKSKSFRSCRLRRAEENKIAGRAAAT